AHEFLPAGAIRGIVAEPLQQARRGPRVCRVAPRCHLRNLNVQLDLGRIGRARPKNEKLSVMSIVSPWYYNRDLRSIPAICCETARPRRLVGARQLVRAEDRGGGGQSSLKPRSLPKGAHQLASAHGGFTPRRPAMTLCPDDPRLMQLLEEQLEE